MPTAATAALLFACGYLLGSIPFGVILARAHGVDLQRVGSGNIGATNAARALGKGWGVLVMLLDAAKATVPMLLLERLWPEAAQPYGAALLGAGAFIGHILPFTLRFRGGKGVATAFGAFLALQPLAAAAGLLTYALAFGLSRISSVGSLSAVASFPLWLYLCHAPGAHWALAGLVALVVLLRHRGNISRLLQRREQRL